MMFSEWLFWMFFGLVFFLIGVYIGWELWGRTNDKKETENK